MRSNLLIVFEMFEVPDIWQDIYDYKRDEPVSTNLFGMDCKKVLEYRYILVVVVLGSQ